MLYYTVGQWRIFVTLAACGMLAGAWYGVCARIAKFLEAGFWLNAFFDLASAVGIWVIVCFGLLISNYGEVRVYALAAAAFGFALYRLTIAHLMGLLLGLAARAVRAAGSWLGRLTLTKKILR